MSSGESESQQGEYAVQSDTGVDAGVPDDRGETLGEPDVVLDIPVLNVEEGTLQVEELELRVSFKAELADLVKINIGVEAEVEGVELEVKGVEVQAQQRGRLDNVRAIFSDALQAIEHSPQFFRDWSGTDQSTDSSRQTAPDDLGAPEIEESTAAEEADNAKVEATSAARRKARDLGLDLSSLKGTGSGGRIILRDVQRAAKG
jgi:pyruvate/2-oxoglutarate dehydrogenase complex dihydrolipoamide acyltransferase (E2) component